MNQEWVERLRDAYAAFSRGDFDAALEFVHPEIEFLSPTGEPYRGIDRLREWMEPDAFEKQVIDPLEFFVSGNRILVRQLFQARGAGSGIELEVRSWGLWTVSDDGRVIRYETFLEHQEADARRAAELSD